MFLSSFFVQSLSSVILFIYYYLITQSLDLGSENVFFICLTITALSILFTDFSFALTHVKLGDTIVEALKSSFGFRNSLIFISVIVASIYWLVNISRLELSYELIAIILLLQITENIVPYYLLIVGNLGIFGQIIKCLKNMVLVVVIFSFKLNLNELLIMIIFSNLFIYFFMVIYFKHKFDLHLGKYIVDYTRCSSKMSKIYLENFLPNLGGLLINVVIPVFGVQFLNKSELNTLVLTDRFVRNFENIIQSVLQWNLRRIKDLNGKQILKYSKVLLLIAFMFITLAPLMISIMLNAEFDKDENVYLRAYSLIVALGPLLTLIGVKYFIFNDKSLEFSIVIGLIGFVSILVIVTLPTTVPIQIVLPACYCLALIFLIIRGKNMRYLG